MGAFSFADKDRILKREEFLRIGAEGKKVRTDHFIIIYKKNDLGVSRLGITVSRKIGGAVKRNRVKRILREFFRLNRSLLPLSTDFIIIAGRGSFLIGYEDVKDEIFRAFKVMAKNYSSVRESRLP